ncbi:DUF3895 domain-containing protein [Bacillus sp. SM2101]|uniref:DUF3895 domain-containing protein n=1 Tax=Bacillus sp. SM2101 TaxID=2805366 RepID=UPI001BDEC5ED|nr:DUF3895 domain-containing protein [Bacillus sp. SM2101]
MSQITFDDLFSSKQENVKNEPSPNTPLYLEILDLLESGYTSTIEICEFLIESGKVSKDRYTTNKPKVYVEVCSILDNMVKQEKVSFIEDNQKKDRIYQLK